MAIAPTLQKYLDQHVTYEVIPHMPTMSSMRTAEVCHIPGRRLAKGVVLRRNGGYLLAVVPATHHVRLADLSTQLGEAVDLAAESEIDQLFGDCAHGAVPPFGDCYGLDVIVDDSIEAEPDVYLEGGDHATLIHLTHAQFAKLTAEAAHGRFSARGAVALL
jgi:Ala-tRNA(Pro) deacylase